MTEACETCKCWLVDDEDGLLGRCRRYPANMAFNNGEAVLGDYPVSEFDDWCGEWRAEGDLAARAQADD